MATRKTSTKKTAKKVRPKLVKKTTKVATKAKRPSKVRRPVAKKKTTKVGTRVNRSTKVAAKNKAVASKVTKKKQRGEKTVTGIKSSKEELTERVAILIRKGRQRGFVTYNELLKEFPAIENNIIFLEDLYAQFDEAGIDVLEEGGLLDDIAEVPSRGRSSHGSESSLDSVQMYLKEILSRSMEQGIIQELFVMQQML